LEWPRGQQAILLTEWLWSSAPERRAADIPALVLSPEAQILHLTSHLTKHHWGRLLWFYDIAQLLRYYEDELDWNLILAMAEEFEIIKALQVTLAKTMELLAPPLPPGVLERVESKRAGRAPGEPGNLFPLHPCTLAPLHRKHLRTPAPLH
jgi:hypothetical protein